MLPCDRARQAYVAVGGMPPLPCAVAAGSPAVSAMGASPPYTALSAFRFPAIFIPPIFTCPMVAVLPPPTGYGPASPPVGLRPVAGRLPWASRHMGPRASGGRGRPDGLRHVRPGRRAGRRVDAGP